LRGHPGRARAAPATIATAPLSPVQDGHATAPDAAPGPVTEARARAIAPVPSAADGGVTPAASSGRGASGEPSGDGPREGRTPSSSAIPTPAIGAAGHEAVFASAAVSPAAAHAAVAALAVPAATPAVDAPATVDLPLPAARLEQALAALDPDVKNLQSMVRAVRLFTSGDGVSEARLQLDPEHLGPVALTVRVEQGTVSAHFRAETPAAQRWIETHQQDLRSNLREQGLEVKEVVVTTDPDGRRERRQDAPPARQARARRTTSGADEPRFEVLV